MRIYDPRLGKFLSVDPIGNKFPELTPFQFASDRPVDGIDMDGLEYTPTKDKQGNIVDYVWTGGGTVVSCGNNDPRPIFNIPSGSVFIHH